VHVPSALQLDRIADLLDRERRGNRHDELPGNKRQLIVGQFVYDSDVETVIACPE